MKSVKNKKQRALLRYWLAALLIAVFTINVNAENMCSDTSSNASTGSLFDSGGAGGNYGNRENCSFLIQPASGSTITLSFSAFNVQTADGLTVYDGTNSSGTLLGSFTGTSIPADLTATSGAMFLVFTSNPGGNRAGFESSWSTASARPTCNVADNFSAVSYGQNDGSASWTGDWLEVNESDGPGAGIARVNGSNCSSGNCLRLGVVSGGTGQTYGDTGVLREVDLSGASSATLTFNYRTGFSGGIALVRLFVSGNGGTSWQQLQQYFIASTSFTAIPQTFDLTPYIANNTQIRFLADGFNAVSGFYVDDIDITHNSNQCSLAPTCVIFRDEFSTESYSRQDGSVNWFTNWIESGDNGNASSGDIEISSGELRLEGDGSGSPSIQRGADLSGYTSATLSFNYRETGRWEGNDDIDIEVSNDGGSNWTLIRRFTNDQGSRSQTFSQDISSHISNNFRVRFVEKANSSSEIFYFDNVQVEACGSAVGTDHYEITYTGSALTCEPISVTITGHDSSDNQSAPGSGTVINLSTSTGEGFWSNPSEGVLTDNGNGNATYTFAANAAVQLSFNHFNPATVNFNINSGSSPSEQGGSEDPSIIFRDTGFRFVDNSDNPMGTQISGKTSSQHFLQAVRTDSVTQQCVALFPDPSVVAVDLAAECETPSNCAGQMMAFNGNNLATVNDNGGVGASSYTNLNLSFAANAKSAFSINYPDAGRMRLNARAEVLDGTGAGTGEYIEGELSFVVKPAGLCVEATEANSSCSGPDFGDCTAFRKVDLDFNLRVSGRAWGGSGESNTDYCDNAITENFQLSNINLSSTLVAPAGGNNATLSASAANISGVTGLVDQALSVDEVGVFSVTAAPAVNYFGETITASTSANIGRFIPHHYVINNGAIVPAAGTFSYLGQPFTVQYDIRAVDSSDNLVSNYRDAGSNHDFIKLDIDSDVSYGAVNDLSGSLTYLSSRLSSSAASFTWGNGEALLVNAPLTLSRAGSVDGPFDNTAIGARAIDSDGVTLEPGALDLDTESPSGNDRKQLGATVFRYGRVFIPPVYGPEVPLNDLTAIPFDIEYWDGTTFVTNTDDSSSVYDSWTLPALGGCTDGSVLCADVTVSFPSPPATVINGKSDPLIPITISRPGAGKTGDLTIQVDVDPWLEYDWLGAGDIDPSTQINFGSYRGHDRIIYWRER